MSIYIRAAERLDRSFRKDDGKWVFCCAALSDNDQFCCPPLFKELFKSKYLTKQRSWFGAFCIKENQEHRIMAMLFMHEITKGKGK